MYSFNLNEIHRYLYSYRYSLISSAILTAFKSAIYLKYVHNVKIKTMINNDKSQNNDSLIVMRAAFYDARHFRTTQPAKGSRARCQRWILSANQIAQHVRHFPRIKSGDTCIGFPVRFLLRHAALPSFSTRNVVVLCPLHTATPSDSRDWPTKGTEAWLTSIASFGNYAVQCGIISRAFIVNASRFSLIPLYIAPYVCDFSKKTILQ